MAAEDLPRKVHNREQDITEEHSFDGLARGLASGMSRRQALKLLGASLAGGLLALFGGVGAASAADAGCKRPGKKCSTNSQCCSEICANGTCACITVGRSCHHPSDCCSGICDPKVGTCP